MKRLSYTLLAAIFAANLQAQNPAPATRVQNPVQTGSNSFLYTYDYTNPTPEWDSGLKPRHKKDKIYVRVENINRLALDVQATGENSSIPLAHVNMFDSLASLKTASLSPATNAVTAVDTTTKTERRFTGNNKKLFRMIRVAVDPYAEEKQKIVALQGAINADFPTLVTDLKQLEFFAKFAKNVPLTIGNECCSQSALRTAILADPFLRSFYPGIATFQNLQAIVNTVPPAVVTDIKAKEDAIRAAEKEAEAMLAKIQKSCKQNKTQDQDFCDLGALEGGFPADLDKALEQAGKVSVTSVLDAVTQLNTLLAQVDNSQNFRFLSKEMPAEGDNVKLSVRIQPKPAYAGRFPADTIEHLLPIRGKFEWAIGPALNFHISKSLQNFSYQIDSAYRNGKGATDTFTIKRNRAANQFLPSVGLMAHFYWQNHTSLTPGITIGLSTSPTNLTDLRAYLGGSLLIGSITDKVIFSAGLAGGSVDRLKANLVEGENPKSQVPFEGSKLGSPQTLVEKVFHVGIYFGFSYKIN